MRILWVSEGRIIGAEHDDYGVPWVVRYTVEG
jgi:hypothetical protein